MEHLLNHESIWKAGGIMKDFFLVFECLDNAVGKKGKANGKNPMNGKR